MREKEYWALAIVTLLTLLVTLVYAYSGEKMAITYDATRKPLNSGTKMTTENFPAPIAKTEDIPDKNLGIGTRVYQNVKIPETPTHKAVSNDWDENMSETPDKNSFATKKEQIDTTSKSNNSTIQENARRIHNSTNKKVESKTVEPHYVSTREYNNPEIEYHPCHHVAVPIPVEIAELIEHKGIVGKDANIQTKCENNKCYILLDKNVDATAVNTILRNIIPVKKQVQIRAEILRKGEFAVVKATVEANRQTRVEYATADEGTFAVVVKIPKSDINSPEFIDGNIIFIQTDPILKIYLRSDGNSIAVVGFTVKKAVDLKTTETIEFAACATRIANLEKKGANLQFQILDGNTPVYIPNVKVMLPGTIIHPQYDEYSKKYMALLPNNTNANVKIVAYAEGCGEIIHTTIIGSIDSKDHENNTLGTLAAILAVLAIAVAITVKRM